ncbi:DUF2793 domain-containing protein [Zavarzinia sp. CC-PAN008]|uniref:DUF2793 domain-containing protein n=1 Tax=Zavarzinia sp. CC-PAN008 TaxID=3243332 RepID=UPI003F746675
MTTTPIGGLPLLPVRPVNPDVIHNQAILLLEVLLRGVLDKDLSAPPAHGDGQAYIVAAGGSGAWTGKDGRIALSYGGAWLFWPDVDGSGTAIVPGAAQEGLRLWVADEDLVYRWNGSAWTARQTLAQGSLAAPSLHLAGDPDTGIDQTSGANTLSLIAGGSEQVVVGAWTLLVQGEANAAFAANRYSNSGAGAFNGRRLRGSLSSPAAVQQNDLVFAHNFSAWGGSLFRVTAQIQATVTETTPSDSAMGGMLTLATTPAGGVSPSERLRIGMDGAVAHRANATTVIDASSHLGLRSYTVGTLPAAGTAARLIYVSDGTGSKRLAVSDGGNWRWPDGVVVS